MLIQSHTLIPDFAAVLMILLCTKHEMHVSLFLKIKVFKILIN